MNRLNFILEIRDWEKHLIDVIKNHADGDLFLLYNTLKDKTGTSAFLCVLETFLKTQIIFPEKPVVQLKKIYLSQNKYLPVGKLARKLDVDTRTIFAWLAEMGVKRSSGSSEGATLFDE